MSAKRETLLIGVLCIFATIPAFADSDWLVVETDNTTYKTGDSMEISGFVFDAQMPQIAIKIYDPDGEILGAYNVDLESDDTFTKTVSLDSPFYDKSGRYSIEFEYGQETDELLFQIDGVAQTQAPPAPQLAPAVLMVVTDKDSYSDNEFITISGLVSDVGDPTILIGIFDPDGAPTGFYMPQVGSDLEFSASFLAKSGVNFKKPGTYTVKANYGQSKQTTTFSFVDSPPQNNAPADPPPQIEIKSQPAPKPADPPAITPKPVPPKPVQPNPVQAIPVQTVPIQTTPTIVNTPVPQEQQTEQDLSPEDTKIGKILNEMTLRCDNSKYTDSIVYGEGMGPALMRLCNYDQAVSYFDNSLVTDPENVELLTNKGSALAKLGRFTDSINNYDLALELEPDYAPALINKANALAETGKLEQAIIIYNKILDDDPDNAIVQKNLQNARDEMIQDAKKQEAKQQVHQVSVDTTTLPEVEETKTVEVPKSTNVIAQIGSFFAGIFGFLK